MSIAQLMASIAGELALFAAVGFFLFSLDDLVVDILYFTRRLWRSATVYRQHQRAHAGSYDTPGKDGWMAVFIPAWDESAVITKMLRETLTRYGHAEYRLFVGFYRNDPATHAAIDAVNDERVIPVEVDADGPTTKAHCLNYLHDALIAEETQRGKSARAIILHDAEDLVHPLELAVFDRLIDRAAAIQLPVIPLIDRESLWIGGHYCDEFAESHGKELVVREAVGASIPLAGVACAIRRDAMARLSAQHEGKPFSGDSHTEENELGLRIGGLGMKTMFVRMPTLPGEQQVVASQGHFPSTLDSAVRQKARWIGGIALAGWDRLGWRGRLGEYWMRMRDRRGPLAALFLAAGYLAALLWSQLWLAKSFGAPVDLGVGPALQLLLLINAAFLTWRLAMRFGFTAATYGIWQGFLSIPRIVVGNIITMLAVKRALGFHVRGGAPRWDKTAHVFPETGA